MNNQSDNERIDSVEFDRTKIYEKMAYQPEPEGYSKKIPWIVQQQVAATNGIHYVDRIGKLDDYPLFNLPIPKVKGRIMLDIGSGWGRWLVAGANKGFIPIGADLRLEFCETARQSLKYFGKNGYTVVADLKNLPFKPGIFDLVWSYGVIQHTHKERMLSCLSHINKILANDGYTYLQFPNYKGFRNLYFGPVKRSELERNNYNSWAVRYYTIEEYRQFFESEFGNFYFEDHCFFGIGIFPEDLKYVSFRNKILCSISLLMSGLTKIITPLKYISDSVFIKAEKNPKLEMDEKITQSVELFESAHKQNPENNLNLMHLLACPVSGDKLKLNDAGNELISQKAGLAYPIKNEIPIMIASEARTL